MTLMQGMEEIQKPSSLCLTLCFYLFLYCEDKIKNSHSMCHTCVILHGVGWGGLVVMHFIFAFMYGLSMHHNGGIAQGNCYGYIHS